MKKFTEQEIFSVPTDLVQGGNWPDHLQQLMKNQNEIIDWIVKYKHKYNTLKNKVEKNDSKRG